MSLDNLNELQQTADYRRLEQRLQFLAVSGLIFGGLSIVVGLLFMSASPLNWIPVALGATTILIGLWGVGAPGRTPLAGHGILLIAIGAWNIWVSFLNARVDMSAGGGPLFVPALGVLQIVWGLQDLVAFVRLTGRSLVQPTMEQEENLGHIIDELSTSGPPITLRVSTFVRQEIWRGFFAGELSIFIEDKTHRILLALGEDIGISVLRQHRGKLLPVVFSVNGRLKRQAKIAQGDLDRYNAWRMVSGKPISAGP